MTIGIVDDQKLIRQSIAALIASNLDFEMVLECATAAEYIDTLAKMSAPPDVNLLDIEMPGMNGMELNSLLQSHYPGIKVMGLSIHAREAVIAKMVQDGACGYLVKNCDKDELFAAIYATYRTGFYINQSVLKAIQRFAGRQPRSLLSPYGVSIDLTQREIEVIKLICMEHNANEIAEKLFISARTVEGHRNNLLLKTGCHNVAGLVLFAVKNSIVNVTI